MIPIWTASVAEKLLNQFQKLMAIFILAAIVIILADAAAEKDVAFFGLKMATDGAYSIAAFAFIATVLMICQLCARLAEIVKLADATEAPKAIAALFNHSWGLNPFAYFGPRTLAKISAAFGAGALVFIWWLGLLAITQLWYRMSQKPGVWEYGLWIGYVAAGLIALASIVSVHLAIYAAINRFATTDCDNAEIKELRLALRHVTILRVVVAVLFCALGYWFFYLLTHIGM